MPTSLPTELGEAREIVLRFQRFAKASLEPGVAIINSIGDDVFCAPINLTARVVAHAVGGQILCTEPIARALRGIAEFEARPI